MNKERKSLIVSVYGVVQGVGFRPFVHRIAVAHRIAGNVINKGSFVEITAQGTAEDLEKFLYALEFEAPERSSIVKISTLATDLPPLEDFSIDRSQSDSGTIFIPPDIATCHECRRELFDPTDRRYLHSFINCTACGPRLTILEALPYDRERTSMKKFPMCGNCHEEYFNIASRRYDAQPVCCNECGPQVYVLNSDFRNAEAITYTRKMLMAGKIAAIKGIGGFHLACDGRNPQAIQRLRELKHRPRKPFAVMMRDMAAVKKECVVTSCAESWLDGCEKPILLLEKSASSTLPENLAPGNPTLGVMLPYAPLQMLLFDYPDDVKMSDVLVMTSGNVSGAPICRSEEDAVQEISSFCDVILSHDRDIRLRADDSVMSLFEDKPYMIRRSRGFAPLPLELPFAAGENVLAIGAELKNAFCIVKKNMAYLAPHIGDMEDVRSNGALQDSMKLFQELLECKAEKVVCDLHPGYHTTRIAESMGLPLLKVQHHWAHILSCMAENKCAQTVIGVAMDGTGYGSDGTIWGGEVLISSPAEFERFGSIAPFAQAGGDASSREGWRIAASLLQQCFADKAMDICTQLGICNTSEYKILSAMIKNRINTVNSTSAGRLFDGVSALLGIARTSTFEGDAAMSLQFAAEKFLRENADTAAAITLKDFPQSAANIMPTTELFKYLAEERLAGADAGLLAYIFHLALAKFIGNMCEAAREKNQLNICALSGGTFQNHLLLDLSVKELKKRNFEVLLHRLVPPNDGGISLGQAMAAAWKYKN